MKVRERLILRRGDWRTVDLPVRYGFWVHEKLGPVLIDTGYGPRVTEGARRSLPLRLYAAVLRPHLHEEEAPLEILRAHGFSANDVENIIITHFHADHVAALRDFPRARFWTLGAAFDQMMAMSAMARIHNGIFSELFPDDFAKRLVRIDASSARDVGGALGEGHDVFGDGSVFAVPFPGHALGHFGLFWPEFDLLYAVDVEWRWRAIIENRHPAGPAHWIAHDKQALGPSTARVKAFADRGGRVVLCHDFEEASPEAGPSDA